MKATLSVIASALLLGCASSSSERQAPPRTATDPPHTGAPAKAAAPAARDTPAAANPGAMTAAEAAEKAHEEWVRTRQSGSRSRG